MLQILLDLQVLHMVSRGEHLCQCHLLRCTIHTTLELQAWHLVDQCPEEDIMGMRPLVMAIGNMDPEALLLIRDIPITVATLPLLMGLLHKVMVLLINLECTTTIWVRWMRVRTVTRTE